jgi:ribonuclease BN (tRNA processing enzyme)
VLLYLVQGRIRLSGSFGNGYVRPDGSVDRTIVLSGDTSLFDGMEEHYAGADILFHEAYSFDPKTNYL